MEKFQIIDIKNDLYTLININSGKVYEQNMIFYDIDFNLQPGMIIEIHEELLDTSYISYNTVYRFGDINSYYGKTITNEEHMDLVSIVFSQGKIYLKRFYG